MRCLIAALIASVIALCVLAPANAASLAAPLRSTNLVSADAVLHWISRYREHPRPDDVPAIIQAASRFGAFENPERAGIYVGFLAGVLTSNPRDAEEIAARSLAMQERDRWVVMRGIAYSGLPNWQVLLRRFACRMPRYDVLSDRYINGKMATLAQFEVPPTPSTFERVSKRLRLDQVFGGPPPKLMLEPSAESLDVLWGYYFATGGYGPVMHIVDMLPLAADHDDADRLTVGSMAKYSLAANAMHDADLLATLKSSRKARGQPKAIVVQLDDVIDAAETVDTARVHKEALAAIEEVRSKGPAYKRTVSWWSFIGQSAIAGGCIAAAVMGQVEFGIPCVVGGAASGAAMNFWANSPQ
ncbi:MAG: hypothetical protein ACXWJ8_01865 [Xanthobacteraceae bacterium]